MIPLQHIHPMVVHFPIVLLMAAVLLDAMIVIRGGNLALRQCLPLVSTAPLSPGAPSVAPAAACGGLAADRAVAADLPEAISHTHETRGFAAMGTSLARTTRRPFATWRGAFLSGPRGWILALAGAAGVGVSIVTAFFGGDRVPRLGANAAPIKA